jgi:filamentous hemagglutinin family protein
MSNNHTSFPQLPLSPGQAGLPRTRGGRLLIAALLLGGSTLFAAPALAGPAGGQVSAGSGTISQSGVNTTIDQHSQNLAINWQSFNIGADESVRFNQPNSSSIALNRVLGQNPSEIFGNLSANGQVFVLNPNGVLFGQSAHVNVGGLVASTLNMSDDDLMAGNHVLANESGTSASVVNKGALTAAKGGYVALVGPNVSNEGVISATMGTALLAAGDQVTLNVDNGSLISYSVDKGALNALAQNKQLVQADGGRVYMTAKAANSLGASVVNNSGVVEARTVVEHDGVIELTGGDDAGEVRNSGTLDASAANGGTGGKVTVTGHNVLLADGSKIDASGKNGGGTVNVGGGWHGEDSAIKNASAVVMAPGATIDVSATDNGDGGTAVLWSQDYTAFGGKISAKGGANGGKGGRVETSSHGNLYAVGTVDASAAGGEGGNWLLDPSNVVIADSGDSGNTFSTGFYPTQDSTILTSSIVTALEAGQDVTITTGTGSSSGDITVDGDIIVDGLGAPYFHPMLTLSAANDIIVNNAVSVSGGRMNVVLSAAADVNFGAGGSVSTNGGNFAIGYVSGDTVSTSGTNLTMADGSFINAGAGRLDIIMGGDVSLAAESLISSYGSAYNYDSRDINYYHASGINISADSITSSNTNANTADIVTASNVSLSADTIGGVSNPLKISGPAGLLGDPATSTTNYFNLARTLSVTNTGGNSYIAEMGQQIFSTINVSVGSQASAVQNIQIMGDAGGNGTTGTGHIILENDGSGDNLNILSGQVDISGTPGTTSSGSLTGEPEVYSTSLSLSKSGNITLQDHAIELGDSMEYFYRYGSDYHAYGTQFFAPELDISADRIWSVNPTDFATLSAGTGTFDIHTPGVLRLTGNDVGINAGYAIDISGGSSLYVNNTGGSTYINSVDDAFSDIYLTNVKDSGTHAIHFRDGDHIDYLSTGAEVEVPTISAFIDATCSTTGACGMDVTEANRSITLTANSGDMLFDDSVSGNHAVNTGTGNFSANLDSSGSDMIFGDYAVYTNSFSAYADGDSGNIVAKNDYDGGAPVPQITAGNVSFNQDFLSGTIGGGSKNIQISQAAGQSDNTLSVNTRQGEVYLHELTENHFKTLSTELDDASAAQSIKYDLAGDDDVAFSDDGSKVLIDETSVDISSNNRNWYLYAPSRDIQEDGNSLSTGYYTLNSGQHLRLNGDIVNDGAINLTGSNGIYLLKTVTLDGNSDDAGSSASITTSGVFSAIDPGYSLTMDTHSGDSSAGTINVNNSSAGNAAGAYLADMTFDASGADSEGNDDGSIAISGASFLLNGNFHSTGNTTLSSNMTIDTEQGNAASGGDILFDGRSLYLYYYNTYAFNTATTAAGMDGGNVDLYGTFAHSTLNPAQLTVTATGGAGGAGGTIDLPSVQYVYDSYSAAQSYTGGIINLYGDLLSHMAGITLEGDARLQNSITIASGRMSSNPQTGSGGDINITNISDGGTGHSLTVDSGVDTGGSLYGGSQDFTLNGGHVYLTAGNDGGAYIDTLTVNSLASGTHNTGVDGDITLATVGTEGGQTYTGAATSLAGDITTNGGDIDFSGVSSLILADDAAIKTDRSGGTNDAGAVDFGASTLNGAHNFTLDFTADGGGAAQDLALNDIGDSTALLSLAVKAAAVTTQGVTAGGDITIEAAGDDSDLTLDGIVTTDTGTIVLAAGRNFINNNALDTGIDTGSSGRYLVYSTSPLDSTEGMTGYSKHYGQAYAEGTTPSYAGSGDWFLYSFAPTLTVTPDPLTLDYGKPLTGVTWTYSGFIDGDTETDADISGTAHFTAALTPAGKHDIAYDTGLVSDLGYIFADDIASLNELTVLPAPSATQGGQVVAGFEDSSYEAAYSGAINSVANPPPPPASGTQGATYNEAAATAPPVAGAPHIVTEITLLDTGDVTVENGGINLPSGASGNGGDDSDDDDDNSNAQQ